MPYCCCVCKESLSEKRKKGQDSRKIATRPVVSTKCGHLFHPECLNKAFSRNGAEVWATKECPVCKMTLTVATDLIRIFPTGNAYEDDDGPTVEDLQEQVGKYGTQVVELRNLLEASFLRNRETEKAYNSLKKENEILSNTKGQLMNSKLEYKSRIETLSMENTQLRNTVVSLSKNLAHLEGVLQLGRMNLNAMGPYRPPGPPMHPSFRHHQLFPNNNSMYYQQRWPGPRPSMINNNNNGSRPVGRVASVENLLGHQERSSKAVSMNHLNILVNDSVPDNSINNISSQQYRREKEDYPNILNGSDMNTTGLVVEEKKLSNQSNFKRDQDETDVTNFVDEFMDDLLLQRKSTNGNETKKKYDPIVGQGRGQADIAATGTKQMYGKFYCNTCKAVWGSSRSISNRPQTCRNCNIDVFPYVQSSLQQNNNRSGFVSS